MIGQNGSTNPNEIQELKEHPLRYFTGRREMFNPDTLYGTATEFEPGILHVRLDDKANDAFWLEFTLILSTEGTQ